jgi:RimJ/RimL family protein N-acetyltransferase
LTNREAHAIPGSEPSTRHAPARANHARAHRGPPDARNPPRRYLPGSPCRGCLPGPWRPAAAGTIVVLRDGSTVLIRHIQATDAPLLAGIFARLSPASRWMRFLAAKNHLTEAELRYLTDVDHHDHEALAALTPDGYGIGAARYIRYPQDPHTAEIAIAVVDDWHRRGLGTHLLTQLSDRARRHGVRRLSALISADNEAMARLLARMNAEVTHYGAGTIEYQIPLPPPASVHHHQRAPRTG